MLSRNPDNVYGLADFPFANPLHSLLTSQTVGNPSDWERKWEIEVLPHLRKPLSKGMEVVKMVNLRHPIYLISFVIGIGLVLSITASAAQAAPRNYGCYKVTAPKSINIRQRAFSKSPIVGVARRGQILTKWRFFCALRGFWCPVQKGQIRGYATKDYLKKISCP
ncbi:MAG: hypothetical protein ACR2OX_07235 [Methyloligellaceae bacterium]